VLLTDTLPTQVMVQSISNGGVQTGNQIVWNLGTLAPPTTGAMSVVVRVNAPLANGTILTNRAMVSDAQGQTANASVTTTVRSMPALQISKLAPPTVRAGDILTYTIIFSNTGTAYATSVVITDTIPAYTDWRAGGHSHTATEVRWNITQIAPGYTGYTSFSVRVRPDTPIGTQIVNSQYGIRSAEVPDAALGAPVVVNVAPPTGITLEYFTLKQVGRFVELDWKTVSEENNWGFNVYRNTVEDFSTAMRLNKSLIPGQGRGVTGGAVYKFADTTAATGQTYYYWLEDIDLNGNAQYRLVRTIMVDTHYPDDWAKHRLRLPFIWRR